MQSSQFVQWCDASNHPLSGVDPAMCPSSHWLISGHQVQFIIFCAFMGAATTLWRILLHRLRLRRLYKAIAAENRDRDISRARDLARDAERIAYWTGNVPAAE